MAFLFSFFKKVLLIPSIILVIILAIITFSYYQNNPVEKSLTIVKDWTVSYQDSSYAVELPSTITQLQANSLVTFSTTIDSSKYEYIYFKSVYADLSVWANGELIYQSGQDGTYPSIYLDSPTDVSILRLPIADQTLELRFECTSPTQRGSLSVSPVLAGSLASIFSYLIDSMGFSIMFSLFLLVLSLILAIVTIFVTRFSKYGTGFMWLSIFSLTIGSWVFCDCNLIAIFLGHESVLYLFSFLSLYFLTYPLLQFCLSTLKLHNTLILEILSYVLQISFIVALVLQLTSVADLASMLYYFHFVNLISLICIVIYLLVDSYHYANTLATKFKNPTVILLICATAELSNYSFFHFNVQNSFFIQIGVALFLLYTSYLCATFIYESHAIQSKNNLLRLELDTLSKQLENQSLHYKIITETATTLRRQRHDLRHQLAVIKHYSEKAEFENLNNYLDELVNNIPTEVQIDFCKNNAVNGVVQYYYRLAKTNNIDSINIDLQIPERLENVHDSDMCIIIGNMLDNAIAACKNTENPFIRIHSKEIHGLLVVTMENNYLKISKSQDGDFLSTKSSGGIGLSSITTVAERYRGITRFEAKDGLFSSFVSIRL